MVIADEAHNLGTPDRGPRLELLLGMLRRDRAGTRFVCFLLSCPMLMSLFTWLGGDQALPP
jgi:replicative superfamily II helicase